jgi:hypothetical protein
MVHQALVFDVRVEAHHHKLFQVNPLCGKTPAHLAFMVAAPKAGSKKKT